MSINADDLMAALKQQNITVAKGRHTEYLKKMLLGPIGKTLGINKTEVYDTIRRAAPGDSVDMLAEMAGVPDSLFFRYFASVDVRHVFLNIKATPVWKEFLALSDKHGLAVAMVFNAGEQTLVMTNKPVALHPGQSALLVHAERPYPNAYVLVDGLKGLNI